MLSNAADFAHLYSSAGKIYIRSSPPRHGEMSPALEERLERVLAEDKGEHRACDMHVHSSSSYDVPTLARYHPMQKMVQVGADGVITNHPERLHRLLTGEVVVPSRRPFLRRRARKPRL